jgi:hypothetical protein
MQVAVEAATRTAKGNNTTGTILEPKFHQSLSLIIPLHLEMESLLTAQEGRDAPNHNGYLYKRLHVHEKLKEWLWFADEE